MKVAVYTIALNEAAHAERWANSARDADYRIVADTGSTDETVKKLQNSGVIVHRIAIRPWRFDDARNAAMAHIPDDVDVCCTMDMDCFLEPGWRAKLEAAWTPDVNALHAEKVYRVSVDDTAPALQFPSKSFHARWGYRFRRPVHEELFFAGEGEVIHHSGVVMTEIQDTGKSTRQQYLPLMEVAHREDPRDAQICFWLGRELMYASQNERASELLQRYLDLPSSVWGDERSEAMRFLARVDPGRKLLWLEKARLEAPHRREVWLDLAEEFHTQADWPSLFWAASNGIEKTCRTGSYLDDNYSWGFRLYDLGALGAWHIKVTDRAVEWGGKALELNPGEQRLKDNLEFYLRRQTELQGAA